MKIARTLLNSIVEMMLECTDLKKATKYLDENTIVRCTRIGKHDGRNRSESFVITIGKPNYAERHQIVWFKMAEEPFPVKKIQLKWWKKGRGK